MAGIVLYVALLLALFDWVLQPLIFFLQGLFTLKLLLWLPLLLSLIHISEPTRPY